MGESAIAADEPFRPTKAQLAAAAGTSIPDVIARDLRLLFVGINPSLYSAATGHHFARPGNRFWPTLHASGLTPTIHSPFEDRQLTKIGIGITNIVSRATARADELSNQELEEGGRKLRRKVRRYRIHCVAVLGVTAYRTAFGRKKAIVGEQEETLAGRPLWVLPNPSGLNAHYQLPELAKLYGQLRQFLETL